MGGRVLFALSIAAFPEELPRDVLTEHLRGRVGQGPRGGRHARRRPHDPRPGAQVRPGGHRRRPSRSAVAQGRRRAGRPARPDEAARHRAPRVGPPAGPDRRGRPRHRDRRDAPAEPGRLGRAGRAPRPRGDRCHGLRAARPRARDGPRVRHAASRSRRRRCRPSPARSRPRPPASRPAGRRTTADSSAASLDTGADVRPEIVDAGARSADVGRPPRRGPARRGRGRRRRLRCRGRRALVGRSGRACRSIARRRRPALIPRRAVTRPGGRCTTMRRPRGSAASSARIAEEGPHAPFHRRGGARRVHPPRHRPVPRHHLRLAAVPVRPELGADHRPPRRGHRRLPVLGGRAGAREPVRAAGPRRADRPAAVLDDGLLRRDHQRDRDLHHLVHRPDQDRGRRGADPALGHRRGGALHGPLDDHGGRPRAQPSGSRRGYEPRHLGVPRVAADAATQRHHREPAPPAGLQPHLLDQPRHRPRGHARRADAPLVRTARPRRHGGR